MKGWVSRDKAFDLLFDMALKAGRRHQIITINEVNEAIVNAWGAASGTQRKPTVENISPNLDLIDEIVTSAYRGERNPNKVMFDNLPGRFFHGETGVWYFLEHLFPGNPWLCMGTGKTKHDCKRLSDWRKGPIRELIVPTPN
jgi:hypothetical protein